MYIYIKNTVESLHMSNSKICSLKQEKKRTSNKISKRLFLFLFLINCVLSLSYIDCIRVMLFQSSFLFFLSFLTQGYTLLQFFFIWFNNNQPIQQQQQQPLTLPHLPFTFFPFYNINTTM